MSEPDIRFVDLAAQDGALLERFARALYEREFPDPDERESLANMLAYLANGNGPGNAYIAVVALRGDAIVAGCIADYFARSACGVIEFLVVAQEARGAGTGAQLAAHVEQRMVTAARAAGASLALVCAEMNDPFKRAPVPDNVDPFRRIGFWTGQGYRRSDFPYEQPALSAAQRGVTTLLLAAKPMRDDVRASAPAALFATFLRDYLTYAMRIDDPDSSPAFRTMAAYLRARERVALQPLSVYVGDEPALDVEAVREPGDAAFDGALAVYRRAFARPEIAVTADEFAAQLRSPDAGVAYHLWALRASGAARVDGMASFFGLPHCGFGGYIVLDGALHGGRLRALLARMERALVADSATTRGWYIECEPHVAPVFEHCGFRRLALRYAQPAPAGARTTPVALHLLYKEFGAVYGATELVRAALNAGLADIARAVYHLGARDADAWAERLAASYDPAVR